MLRGLGWREEEEEGDTEENSRGWVWDARPPF